MDTKCVLYVRVSSDMQDYERQIVDLKETAKKENYTIPANGIFEDKLSGFKDESERIGLNRLMKYCLKNNIKIVLVWEISRLARKHLILLRLVEFFKINKINVYFKKQSLWLLDENGLMDDRAGMMISVMGWYGEYEARLMKDRFFSSKKINEAQGRYNGGKIPFGYKLDINKKYVINEEKIAGLDVSEADIVREVFDYYEKGLVCSKICRICRSKNYPKIVTSTHTLARLLRNTSYIGYKNAKLGKRPTPPIISESKFDKVNSLVSKNKTKADKGRKHVYLLRGLLKCSICGRFYVGKQTDDSYICPQNSGSNKTNKNTSCTGGNISVSNIDGIVWKQVKGVLSYQKTKGFDDFINPSVLEIAELKKQILHYQELQKKLEQQRKRVNLTFQIGGSTPEEYRNTIKEIINEKNNCQKDIIAIENKIKYNEELIEESESLSKRLENIESISDRQQMQVINKNLIKEIKFYKISYYKTVVYILFKNGWYDWLTYNSVAKNGTTFRYMNPNYIRFEPETSRFFVLKGADKTILWVTKDMPEEDEKRQLKRSSQINKPIDPIPCKSNSDIYDFDGLMKLEDIPYVLETVTYTKLTYFKDLNKARFNRKR